MTAWRCGARSVLPSKKKDPNHQSRESTIPRRHRILSPFPSPYANGSPQPHQGRTRASNDATGATGGGGWRQKWGLRIFWAWRQRRAALDRHLPLRGHGNTQKNSKQQSTCGWRCARAAGGMGRVMEVTPYARIRNLVGWRRRAAINCRLPLFWVPKAPKQIKQQSTSRRRRGRGAGDCRGARK